MQKTRKLRLSTERLRNLSSLDLQHVRGGYQATGDECKSVNPCPGEYTWFCSP